MSVHGDRADLAIMSADFGYDPEGKSTSSFGFSLLLQPQNMRA